MRPVTSLLGGLVLLAGSSVAALSPPGDPPQGEPIKLTCIWQPGMTAYYRITVESESKTVTCGSTDDRTSHDRMAAMLRTEVYNVRDDGTARIAATITRFRRQSEGTSSAKEVYDSAAPPQKETFETKLYGLVVNRTVIVEMTPDGRVLHVQGLDDIVESVMKSFQSLAESIKSGAPEVSKMMEQTGLGKATKGVADQIGSHMFSSDPLNSSVGRRVGEHWSMNHNAGSSFLGMLGTSEGSCTFESVDLVSGRRIARISTVGSSSTKPEPKTTADAKPDSQMPAFEVNRTTHGAFLFDLDRGRPVRWESRDTGNVKTPEMKFGDHTMPASEMQRKATFLVELVGPEDSIDPQSEHAPGK